MLRTMTPVCIISAVFGRCSLISTPGALVFTGLNSPAPLLSGLRSKVSLWLGPPSIQRRMHDFARPFPALPALLAASAMTGSQPERAGANTPAAESRRKSRRVLFSRWEENMGAPVSSSKFQVPNSVVAVAVLIIQVGQVPVLTWNLEPGT